MVSDKDVISTEIAGEFGPLGLYDTRRFVNTYRDGTQSESPLYYGGTIPDAGKGGVKKVARVRSSKLRRLWEKFTGKKWPKEPGTLPDGRKNKYSGRNQSVSHKKALEDGGTNKVENIEPEPWQLHFERHKRNGDFVRWGKKRKKKK